VERIFDRSAHQIPTSYEAGVDRGAIAFMRAAGLVIACGLTHLTVFVARAILIPTRHA
jgi:hypothetical protein